ncbi:putative methyltransferase [Thiorhodovibrio winogradskyi]|uniref:site-specific DNA-methyltransferase (adenine-specific) n=1 Tax=Thiorhodovibrio winogradskyi TaxID=77007 RepID=A0ABZ0S7W9_9GAMM|nr:site-specific DNA-methyltransferase [Thiorhodovibrio winogradskyi]
MDKLKMHSPDLTQSNIAKLRALFPGCVTEARGEDGQVRLAVDFDLLRQELSDELVEGPQERYHLDWPGKKEALLAANAPTTKALRPYKNESLEFYRTKNLFIEGDNLESLKLLQESYLGKVKMVYIDPPYNIDNDLIYNDDFAESANDFLRRSMQIDEDETRLTANTESAGRIHSNWLTMMYSRIRLSRNLLTDSGVIFISISDEEIHNLRKVCDEIFGAANFCAQFIWNTEGNTDNQYAVKVNHEYIVAYFKNSAFAEDAIGKVVDPNTREDSNLWKGYADNNINKNNPENPPSVIELPVGFPSSEKDLFYPAKTVDQDFFEITETEKFISDEVKKRYDLEHKSGLPVKLDDMLVKDFKLTSPCRIYVGMANKNKLLEFINNGCHEVTEEGQPISFYINSNAAVRYRKKNENPRNILSVLKNFGTTERTKTYLKNMGIYFNYPKPVQLLEYLVKIGCYREGIVMDFFAGSGTTAEAVFSLNAKDSVQRQVILIQLPEPLDDQKKEHKAAYEYCISNNVETNLAEICKERIRRASIKICGDRQVRLDMGNDCGFRVLKLDTSNMADVYYTPSQTDQRDLLGQVANIKPDRTPEDLLFQVLVDWGVDLTLPIREETIQGRRVFFVNEPPYDLLACFDDDVTEELVKELATHQPLRAVFRDTGYATDATRTNVVQIFRQLSPGTEVKSL